MMTSPPDIPHWSVGNEVYRLAGINLKRIRRIFAMRGEAGAMCPANRSSLRLVRIAIRPTLAYERWRGHIARWHAPPIIGSVRQASRCYLPLLVHNVPHGG